MRRPRLTSVGALIAATILAGGVLTAQVSTLPWGSYAHNAQHTAIASVASQPLTLIRWQTPVDLQPQYSGYSLLIHYGSPLVTAANTVIVPVKVGTSDGFRVEARRGSDGALLYTLTTDYSLPPHNWIPSYSPVLTPLDRLYYAGAGGTVYYRNQPDSAAGAGGQIAFYGTANYAANSAVFNSAVKVSTPITVDSDGNIFFGFIVLDTNPLSLQSGIARISSAGVGSFVTASAAAGGDPAITKVPSNVAPALSNDQNVLYFSVAGNSSAAYLVSVDSHTLAPIAQVRLKDPGTLNDARLSDDATASPMVGPDGDVYYGVLENPSPSNHGRGWLLHFNAALSQSKTPGAFGWDDTASVVTSSLVSSYQGASAYLLLTKYNNYAGVGGDGVNKVAILDPNASMVDPITGVVVMKEVITVAGPTPDEDYPAFPNAVREWCINTAVVDPFTKSALVNNEDGILYRWDFTTNTLSEQKVLTAGIGEAYTPTLVGVDGTVYAINNGILFAVGQPVGVPGSFSATATSTSVVALTWSGVLNATGYEVYRSTSINASYTLVLSTTGTSASDTGLAPNTTYLYKVRAMGGGGPSAFTAVDPATTVVFNDTNLGGVTIQAVHITQLRTAVNAMRAAAGLPAFAFSDATLIGSSTLIKRVHVIELRTALDEARAALGLPAILYTDPTLTVGSTVMRTQHITELRTGTQ